MLLRRLLSLTIVLVLVVALMSVFLLACDDDDNDQTQTTTPVQTTGSPKTTPVQTTKPAEKPGEIKIGVLAPLTGRGAAMFGEAIANLTKLRAEQINAAGGLMVGGKPYLLNVVLADDKLTPEGARAAADKLIYEDKVKFIIGPWSTTQTAAIEDYVSDAGVWHAPASTSVTTFTPKHSNTWSPYTGSSATQIPLSKWVIAKYPQIKRIVFLAPDDETGKSWFKLTEEALKPYNLYVKAIYYNRSATDYYPWLTKAVAENPDAIDLDGTISPTATLILKQLYELGYKGIKYSGTTYVAEELLKGTSKESMEGLMGINMSSAMDNAPAGLRQMRADYEAKYGSGSYNTALDRIGCAPDILIAGLKSATAPTPAAVTAALESMKTIDTIFGPGTWGGLKTFGIAHYLVAPSGIVQVHDGKDVLLSIWQPEMP
ncbi:MAG: ABC transporter substrate-binding protein [Dehalococcoidia bacterium]